MHYDKGHTQFFSQMLQSLRTTAETLETDVPWGMQLTCRVLPPWERRSNDACNHWCVTGQHRLPRRWQLPARDVSEVYYLSKWSEPGGRTENKRTIFNEIINFVQQSVNWQCLHTRTLRQKFLSQTDKAGSRFESVNIIAGTSVTECPH
jgi:hypothetical protein